LQAFAIVLLALNTHFYPLLASAVVLGFGTALVYPNFLSVVAENTHPSQRAESLGIFRLWRDSGYVIGVVFSGLLADVFGIPVALFIVAAITAFAGIVANQRMCCTNKLFWKSDYCIPAY
jgi:MFS family permease